MPATNPDDRRLETLSNQLNALSPSLRALLEERYELSPNLGPGDARLLCRKIAGPRYEKWLLRRLVAEPFDPTRFDEISADLRLYDSNKHLLAPRDREIDRSDHGFAWLSNVVAPWRDGRADRLLSRFSAGHARLLRAEATVLHQGRQGVVLAPHSVAAAQLLCGNADVCIARTMRTNYFPAYNCLDHPPLVLFPAGGGRFFKAQHDAFRTSTNHPLSELPTRPRALWDAAIASSPLMRAYAERTGRPLHRLEARLEKFETLAARLDPAQRAALSALVQTKPGQRALGDIPAGWWDDNRFALAVMAFDGLLYSDLPQRWRQEPAVIATALAQNGSVLQCAPAWCRRDAEMVLLAAGTWDDALSIADRAVRGDFRVLARVLHARAHALCPANVMPRLQPHNIMGFREAFAAEPRLLAFIPPGDLPPARQLMLLRLLSPLAARDHLHLFPAAWGDPRLLSSPAALRQQLETATAGLNLASRASSLGIPIPD